MWSPLFQTQKVMRCLQIILWTYLWRKSRQLGTALKDIQCMIHKRQQKHSCANGTVVNCSPIIKYLGAWLGQHMQLHDHIVKKCKTDMMNLQKIKSLHPSLTQESAHILVRGLVTSHLDYCNAIFAGLPKVLLKILQKSRTLLLS